LKSLFSAALDFERALGEIRAQLDQHASPAMDAAAKVVADDAASDHEYQNRTGDLQGHTVAGLTRGRLLAGDLEGEVLGDMPYGEFVEARMPFLQPAWDRSQNEAERAFERAMGER
jgi:hypothetical protein